MGSGAVRLLLLVGFVAAVMPAGVTASATRTAGTLSMNASLALQQGVPDLNVGDCPATADEVAARRVFGPFPGLGQVEARYDVCFDAGAPACAESDGRSLAGSIRLTVAGKGEIDVATPHAPCVPIFEAEHQIRPFTVTGGTGSYAGASGSGTLTPSLGPLGKEGRHGTETWTGTLVVQGLEFDLTAPRLTGATNKTVKAKKGSKSARVAFRVTAQDDRNGALPVSCSPRSGFAFPIGKTRVECAASDTSANTTKASFTVTVKRRR